MKKSLSIVVTLFLIAAMTQTTYGQEKGYTFKDKTDIEVTSVKDQHRSGTCWSFAAISFLEAELLRAGKGEYDLSEMFLVRHCYVDKADKYVRMHGKTNYGGGGLAHDLTYVWKKYGLVPEEAYEGEVIGETGHVHGEMDAVLSGYMEAVLKNRNQRLSPGWKNALEGILDAYLGEYPENFTYNGMEFTPASFGKSLELNPDDYITVGSFSHHPFYNPFILEIPDNWGWNEIQNVPIEELINILDNALKKGYTVCWDADVSDKGFDWKRGIALIPEQSVENLSGLERARWDELSDREKQARMYDFSAPKVEKEVTQDWRQERFDNYTTTDDHLMHITGSAKDQDGKTFYKVKNSWGIESHIYEGYFYASEAFMKANTLFFMIHKDALPKEIAKKIGL